MSVTSEHIQQFVDDAYKNIANISQKQTPKTTLSDYGITDAYTNNEVEQIVSRKAVQDDINNMTGEIRWETNDGLQFFINQGWRNYSTVGAIGWTYDENRVSGCDGASIRFKSKNATTPGQITLLCNDGTKQVELAGLPTGEWDWNGQRIHSGQYVNSSKTLQSSVACSTTAKTYDVSTYLPNDGAIYLVSLMGSVTTGSSSGNNSELRVYSDIVTSGAYIWMGEATTRTASTETDFSSCWLPVSTGRKIYAICGGTTGTFTLYARGYMRLYKV